MKIYTKTGDRGQTSLASGERVDKTDLRIETYGTADELNSFVGLLRAKEVIATCPEHDEQLLTIQSKLFNLGAALSDAPGEWIAEADVQAVEGWIDAIQTELEPLRAFILPAGSEAISTCHICRTITRRLERRMCELDCPEKPLDEAQKRYVNRLSDYFFVLSRKIAKLEKVDCCAWQK